jgi:hypothetical protein
VSVASRIAAQQPPVPPRPPVVDTTRRPADTIVSDSAAAAARLAKARADTIKAPTARPWTPRSTEIGATSWHWDRDAIFASGALTLGELVAGIPGLTLFSTNFVIAPQAAAWYGDPGHVRIFIDGVEMDAVNVRNGGITDLTVPPLWALEDVQVERAAGELRVHLRTWRVQRTTPSTRTDVLTGSENINLYRGYFGTRLSNGAVLQLAGQQVSTVSRQGLDGDALSVMVRLGWARGSWSLDGTLLREGVTRNTGARFLETVPQFTAMPPWKGSESVAYVRAAWRDPEADGPWAQLIAATIAGGENNATSSTDLGVVAPVATPGDSVDTTASRAQYIVAAGITRWGLRLSSTNRLRSINGRAYFSPGMRAEYDARLLTVSGFAERAVDSTTRADVLARFAPFDWLNVGAALSRASPAHASLGPATTATRVELGLQWRDRWLTGGVVTRSAGLLAPPIELDTALRAVNAPAATGTLFSLRGPVARGWALDVDFITWDSPGPYRPQTQTRTRLWFESSFLGRFPRGNFHLLASGTAEYRATTYVPLGTNPTGQSAAPSTVYSTLLEIRIGTAVISWQNRNIVGVIYETYPGYVMPRLTNVYGIRWEFWN